MVFYIEFVPYRKIDLHITRMLRGMDSLVPEFKDSHFHVLLKYYKNQKSVPKPYFSLSVFPWINITRDNYTHRFRIYPLTALNVRYTGLAIPIDIIRN